VRERRRKKEVGGEEEIWSKCILYKCENRIMKPIKICLKERRRGVQRVIEGMNLHLWKYHDDETPLCN
jgi:hypothetical protein